MWEIRTDQDGDDMEEEYDSFDSIIEVAEYLENEGLAHITDLDQYLEECISKETNSEKAELDEAVGEIAGTLALAAGGGLLAGAANAIGKKATEKAIDTAESKMASKQQTQEAGLLEQVGSNFVGQNLDPRDPSVVLINHYYPTLCKREDIEAVTKALDDAVDIFDQENGN